MIVILGRFASLFVISLGSKRKKAIGASEKVSAHRAKTVPKTRYEVIAAQTLEHRIPVQEILDRSTKHTHQIKYSQ